MCNFYRHCIPNAACTEAPLHGNLKNSKKNDGSLVEWTEETICAFENTKTNLNNPTTLFYSDLNESIQLRIDASDIAIGAMVEQYHRYTLQSLTFFSKKLCGAQKWYCTYNRDLLAIYEAIKHFRHLLKGQIFKIFSDHKSLNYVFKQNSDKFPPRRTRQLDFISQFPTDI